MAAIRRDPSSPNGTSPKRRCRQRPNRESKEEGARAARGPWENEAGGRTGTPPGKPPPPSGQASAGRTETPAEQGKGPLGEDHDGLSCLWRSSPGINRHHDHAHNGVCSNRSTPAQQRFKSHPPHQRRKYKWCNQLKSLKTPHGEAPTISGLDRATDYGAAYWPSPRRFWR